MFRLPVDSACLTTRRDRDCKEYGVSISSTHFSAAFVNVLSLSGVVFFMARCRTYSPRLSLLSVFAFRVLNIARNSFFERPDWDEYPAITMKDFMKVFAARSTLTRHYSATLSAQTDWKQRKISPMQSIILLYGSILPGMCVIFSHVITMSTAVWKITWLIGQVSYFTNIWTSSTRSFDWDWYKHIFLKCNRCNIIELGMVVDWISNARPDFIARFDSAVFRYNISVSNIRVVSTIFRWIPLARLAPDVVKFFTWGYRTMIERLRVARWKMMVALWIVKIAQIT